MRQTVIVSDRGQLTLPASMRKRFGLSHGGAVILEERDNEMVIKPAAVMEIEMYSDAQIAAWDEADTLSANDRSAVLARLAAQH
jgi:antitoxin PrlF